MLLHQVEHDVASFERILRIDERIIVGGCLQHTYQHRCLLCCKVLGRAAKVGLTGSLDTKGIRTKVHRVGVLCQNLILSEKEFQLIGCNPFFTLQDQHLDTWNIAKKTGRILRTCTEQVLGQLLGEGRSTTCIVM